MPHHLVARALDAWIDPVALFRQLERSAQDVFWLDAGADAGEGWSLLGTGQRDAAGVDGVRLDQSVQKPRSDGVPPFAGGWVGWIDYESGARTAGAPTAGAVDEGDADAGGAAWLRIDRAIAIDHARGDTWLLAPEEHLDSWAKTVAGWVTAATASALPEQPSDMPPASAGPAEVLARHSPHEYGALIARCREAIRAGLAYQLCLTTRFSVPGAHDPVDVYLRLRAATPAHHSGFVRIGARALLSASPEQFLHTSNGIIRTRPIKGTRPRGATPETDAALAAELQVDAKERAENVMIVDLMRNDLSRVCEPGSIRVDGLWQVETYPAVHQLVSTVSGVAAAGVTVERLLQAAFPAGSMTGAPKLSAMTLLHGLEREPRGIYAGCFGIVGLDGAIDLAMVIRSIVVTPGGAFVGAGGGITWGSIADAEVAEVATKARAPLAALGAVLPGPWASDILN